MSFIRSISGLRATLGDDLTPQAVSRYVAGFAAMLPKGSIIIGRDGRPTGLWIEKIIIGTLAACGRKVIALGIVPTPTIQLAVEKSDAAGGIAITASHNPAQWNGMKFINGKGIFLNERENNSLWEYVDNETFLFESAPAAPQISHSEVAIKKHIESIMNLSIFDNVILTKIRNKKFRIVVDAVNASGSVAIPSLLDIMGCEVIPLYCDGSGNFPHVPEPVPENLVSLAEAVKEHKADFGIAVDPDADRLVLVDENGEPIGEESTIVLAIEAVLKAKQNLNFYEKTVVVNHSTTRMVEDIADLYGAKVVRSPVGEINVVKLMQKHDAIIGGEGSGGVILPECHYGRDSLVGTALILYLLTVKGEPLSMISSELPKYVMLKYKKEFEGDITELVDKIEDLFPQAYIIKEDGIKAVFEKSWVQLRASNTEPIVRVIAEAPTNEEASELAYASMNVI